MFPLCTAAAGRRSHLSCAPAQSWLPGTFTPALLPVDCTSCRNSMESPEELLIGSVAFEGMSGLRGEHNPVTTQRYTSSGFGTQRPPPASHHGKRTAERPVNLC